MRIGGIPGDENAVADAVACLIEVIFGKFGG
jgi:hypothetical protein